jgi:hypothetical protein
MKKKSGGPITRHSKTSEWEQLAFPKQVGKGIK